MTEKVEQPGDEHSPEEIEELLADKTSAEKLAETGYTIPAQARQWRGEAITGVEQGKLADATIPAAETSAEPEIPEDPELRAAQGELLREMNAFDGTPAEFFAQPGRDEQARKLGLPPELFSRDVA